MNLTGKWQFSLDEKNIGIKESWASKKFDETINLPGTTDMAEKGKKTEGSEDGMLTRVYKYYGPAWYSRDIEIPQDWADKNIELYLERVIWLSTVWVDGKERGSHDSLATPHVYRLGKLAAGTHRLAIRIDNSLIYNIGDKGHSYGDHMQTVWNGIVGRIELSAHNDIKISSQKIFTNFDTPKLKAITKLNSAPQTTDTLNLRLHYNGELVAEISESLEHDKIEYTTTLELDAVNLWDEQNPNLYELTTTLKTGALRDVRTERVGFRKFTTDGTHFYLNNIPVFLRGNLDNCHFPKTGFPAMDTAGWLRIFKTLKAHGLNHIRFHSWCPPEAAFNAADELGLILQPECGIWIDGWMKGRSQFKPDGIGRGPKDVDEFVLNEIHRIVEAYGNHPSFLMLSIGNELGSSDFDLMSKWFAEIKSSDDRRLYSVSTARKITPSDDYISTHYLPSGATRGLNATRSNWDFEHVISKSNIPVIAHELGQWPVYPDWAEIAKYNGVLRARNYEEFRANALKNGIEPQSRELQKATGKFSQLLYKAEIEAALRTKSMAGFHLLGLQDYSGQGEALIGILDSFYDSKNIIAPKDYRRFCSDTVPLLRTEKFVWQSSESFNAEVEVSHYGKTALENINCTWQLKNQDNKILKTGTWSGISLKMGTVTKVGEIKLPLDFITNATHLTLEVKLGDELTANGWSLWVYPQDTPEINTDNVLITDYYNEEVAKHLASGGRVLLDASSSAGNNTIALRFNPIYWSVGWFPAEGKKQIGLLVNSEHPALKHFPTSYHSDLQWQHAIIGSRGLYLNKLPAEFRPIVQPVDSFHYSNKIGAIFEANVGTGKILITGLPITEIGNDPVKRQLRYSLLNYAASDAFAPKNELPQEFLSENFPKIYKSETTKNRGEHENAVLRIKAATKWEHNRRSGTWNANLDTTETNKGCAYELKNFGVWRDGDKTSWFSKNGECKIITPEGLIGTLYIQFHDWDSTSRRGRILFEGRLYKLDRHHEGDGVWMKFHVMREDTLDRALEINFQSTSGANLMVRELVLVSDNEE